MRLMMRPDTKKSKPKGTMTKAAKITMLKKEKKQKANKKKMANFHNLLGEVIVKLFEQLCLTRRENTMFLLPTHIQTCAFMITKMQLQVTFI